MAFIATIGFFDGVHLGHRYLISQLQAKAKELGLESMVISFLQHPRSLTEGQPPLLLLTTQERQALLSATGVDRVQCFDFAAIRHLTAQDFMRLLHDQYNVTTLLMGYDHRFGCDRLASFEDYVQAGQQVGVTIYLAHQSPLGDVSSTKIRHALEKGHIEDANKGLGYAYTLTGIVVPGQHIGTQLGFPTANLQVPADKLIPASGVYTGVVDGHKALINIGTNPTISSTASLTIEVHIPHFHADLYGQTLSVQLLTYLRQDQHFPSTEALVAQIEQDIEHLDGMA